MLKHLVGQSYCLETPAASLGLYLGADKHCILIDSGAVADGQQVVSILQKQGWEVSALINTHAHVDHSGANRIIADTFGAAVYASAAEKVFLENPWLAAYTLFSAHPPRSLANRFIVPPASPEVHALEHGMQVISGVSLNIIDLGGHTPGQIGVMTPDGVLFAGDSLLSSLSYQTFPCLVMADVAKQLASLDLLEKIHFKELCLAHGGCSDQPGSLIDQNRVWLKELINDVLLALPGQLLSREEIVGRIIAGRTLPVNTTQYYLVWSTVSAVISYLLDNHLIKTTYHPNGIVYSVR
jgi:glyoxylase-like metal-dependent hydrolase (beta-lactamase superfamily II)